MIPISKPLIADEEKNAVLAVLESGMLAQGRQVEAFEVAFAAYCGTKHAVATSSGTTALHLALLAHGIGPGDEVITTPFTFAATANAILYVGARPVFADIEYDTFNLAPEQVERRITPATRAVVAVHLFGHAADTPRLVEVANRHGLVLIEDACQAHGAELDGRKVGTFCTGCFSFYPTKNMTSGEGGMVVSDNTAIADRVRMLRNHGMRERYYHEIVGYNFRMTDLHAAIGLAQLAKLDRFNEKRMANASFLTSLLSGIVACPTVRPTARHVFHQYTVRLPHGRDLVKEMLRVAGVDSGIYYPVPVHRQQPYRDLGLDGGFFPVAETACREVLSLPVHPQLGEPELERIANALRSSVDRIRPQGS
ncbi:MAG: DegT/DnrJ/EryC1/StrS family aminotransferase [Acidobacteria bacterium]|nr:DegT/DnrJ/EryC1/StrS family aminotransferase [Acidobacteriota bacterium]